MAIEIDGVLLLLLLGTTRVKNAVIIPVIPEVGGRMFTSPLVHHQIIVLSSSALLLLYVQETQAATAYLEAVACSGSITPSTPVLQQQHENEMSCAYGIGHNFAHYALAGPFS